MQVEQAFKVMWADHGDDISRQYAGTGALKSGFTRTGKRGIGGLLDDGVKSIVRYYLNNFQDGRKQDALDLASGAFRVAPGRVLVRVCGLRFFGGLCSKIVLFQGFMGRELVGIQEGFTGVCFRGP